MKNNLKQMEGDPSMLLSLFLPFYFFMMPKMVAMITIEENGSQDFSMEWNKYIWCSLSIWEH